MRFESKAERRPRGEDGGWRVVCRSFFMLAGCFVVAVSPILAQPAPPPLDEATAFAGAVRHEYLAADGHTPLRIYLFTPPQRGAAPVTAQPAVVFFHGSGWVQGWVSQFSFYARALASRGMVAVCADYRTQSSHHATPFDGVADAREALGWMQTHAEELRIDPQRVAAAGSSAGAHLALCAALIDTGKTPSTRPAALVLLSAVTDTTMEGHPAGVPLFRGHERDLSPRHHLATGAPPMLLLHGAADAWVPVASAERFVREGLALGNRAELVVFAGRGHAFYNHPDYRPGVRSDDFFTVLFLIEKFFASLSWISPPETIGTVPSAPPTP